MTIEVKKELSFRELVNNSWSGAIDTLNTIEENNKEEELMQLLNDIFEGTTPTDTELNDYLWFDSDNIFDMLGINEEEEE